MATVTPKQESMQYDGTNGTALVAWLDGASYTITSDTGTQLVLTDFEGSRKTIPLSGWVVRSASHELTWQGSDAAYTAQWSVI